MKAIEATGYRPGEDFYIAIDAASTEMYDEAKKAGREGEYLFWKSGEFKTVDQMVDFWDEICSKYPVISLEDGLAEEDWEGWKKLTERIGHKVQIVGEDLFVTNTERVKKGIDMGVANSVLIKVNRLVP